MSAYEGQTDLALDLGPCVKPNAVASQSRNWRRITCGTVKGELDDN